jgi:hypothetical protein
LCRCARRGEGRRRGVVGRSAGRSRRDGDPGCNHDTPTDEEARADPPRGRGRGGGPGCRTRRRTGRFTRCRSSRSSRPSGGTTGRGSRAGGGGRHAHDCAGHEDYFRDVRLVEARRVWRLVGPRQPDRQPSACQWNRGRHPTPLALRVFDDLRRIAGRAADQARLVRGFDVVINRPGSRIGPRQESFQLFRRTLQNHVVVIRSRLRRPEVGLSDDEVRRRRHGRLHDRKRLRGNAFQRRMGDLEPACRLSLCASRPHRGERQQTECPDREKGNGPRGAGSHSSSFLALAAIIAPPGQASTPKTPRALRARDRRGSGSPFSRNRLANRRSGVPS